MRRLVVDLGETQAEQLEELRVKRGDRSWAQTIRNMIAWEANAHSRPITVEDIYRVDRSAVERQLGHPIKTLAPWEAGKK